MNRRQLLEQVKRLLSSRFGLGLCPDEIPDSSAIFGAGLGLDSMAAIELVVALEKEFGFTVHDEDLTEANFSSVAALASYVQRRTEGGLDR
jgi:acyl carrier protein